MFDPIAASRGAASYSTTTRTPTTPDAPAADKDKTDPSVILQGLAGLNAALKAWIRAVCAIVTGGSSKKNVCAIPRRV
jgi:hypothetical protein